MVAPVVSRPDKLTKIQLPFQFCTFFDKQSSRTVQKVPWTTVTNYSRAVGQYNQTPARWDGGYPGESGTDASTIWSDGYNKDQGVATRAGNVAYDRLKGKLYTQASDGVDIVEWRQSYSMIVKASSTLLDFTRAVRRLRFLEAARILKLHAVPKGVSPRRAWANNWLEYHFGWEPLMADIHESLNVLNNPVNSFVVEKGKGYDATVFKVNTSVSFKRLSTFITECWVAEGARINAITNRGLHSLDQFGVINPASLAWELVPFSFVVDWFVNVGQVLASYSDYAGMSLTGSYASYMIKTRAFGSNVPLSGSAPPLIWSGSGVWASRAPGFPQPSISVKTLRPPSKVRAATAISLLLQGLR